MDFAQNVHLSIIVLLTNVVRYIAYKKIITISQLLKSCVKENTYLSKDKLCSLNIYLLCFQYMYPLCYLYITIQFVSLHVLLENSEHI